MRSFSLPILIRQEGIGTSCLYDFLERTDQWHFRYDMTNCLYASLIEAIFTNCACKPDLWQKGHLKPCRGHQIICVKVGSLNILYTVVYTKLQKYLESFGDKSAGLDKVKNLITGKNTTCLQVFNDFDISSDEILSFLDLSVPSSLCFHFNRNLSNPRDLPFQGRVLSCGAKADRVLSGKFHLYFLKPNCPM